MTVAHATFTEYLTHILHDIALNRRTGLLRLEYVGAHTNEKGAIFFKSGHTVFACTDQATGERALSHIAQWNKVYYSFLEGVECAIPPNAAFGRHTHLLPATVRQNERHTRPLPIIPGDTLPTSTQTGSLPHVGGTPPSIEEAAHLGAHAVFRTHTKAAPQQIICQMERQDRLVFMLLDGRRTVRDIAHLVHRNELEVARTLVRFLSRGYIECVQVEDHHSEQDVAGTLARLLTDELSDTYPPG